MADLLRGWKSILPGLYFLLCMCQNWFYYLRHISVIWAYELQLAKDTVARGEPLEVELSFDNPLDCKLTDVVIRLEGPGIQKDMRIAVGWVRIRDIPHGQPYCSVMCDLLMRKGVITERGYHILSAWTITYQARNEAGGRPWSKMENFLAAARWGPDLDKRDKIYTHREEFSKKGYFD